MVRFQLLNWTRLQVFAVSVNISEAWNRHSTNHFTANRLVHFSKHADAAQDWQEQDPWHWYQIREIKTGAGIKLGPNVRGLYI